jgi:hypothetical protein
VSRLTTDRSPIHGSLIRFEDVHSVSAEVIISEMTEMLIKMEVVEVVMVKTDENE